MGPLPRPALRGHFYKKLYRDICLVFLAAGAATSGVYFFTIVPRRKAIEDFYKTYDAEAHVKFLNKYGYLQSGLAKQK